MTIDRVDPPPAAGELEMTLAWLDYHRATLLQKIDGLTPEQLRTRSCQPSTLSLLGLVRHMTDVERGWMRRGIAGEEAPSVLDYDAEPEADFDNVDDADSDADIALYRAEVEACRAALAAHPDLDRVIRSRDDAPTVRWVLMHMVEEYARHNGHADLLRERIDGATGH